MPSLKMQHTPNYVKHVTPKWTLDINLEEYINAMLWMIKLIKKNVFLRLNLIRIMTFGRISFELLLCS